MLFGSTALGVRSTRTVTLANVSTVLAYVTSATFDSAACTVAPLGTRSVAIARAAPARSRRRSRRWPRRGNGEAPSGGCRRRRHPGRCNRHRDEGHTEGHPSFADLGSGGTTVTITGTGLKATTAVLFGSTSVAATCTATTCTATTCTAVSPSGTGQVHVRAVTPSGTNAAVAADRFTYR